MPEPHKFVESSENSLSVHLEGWQDANCPTVYFMVEQRWWSLICSSNKEHMFYLPKKGTRKGGVELGEQERQARGRHSYLQPESGHLVPDQGDPIKLEFILWKFR